MAGSQANITAVRVADGGAEVRVSWDSTDPPGTWFQVYVERRLVWYGQARSRSLALPAPGRRVLIDVQAVGSASEARADRSGDLPAVPGGGDRVRLSWFGGAFQGDVSEFRVFRSPAPGGAVSYLSPVGRVGAYPNGVTADGFGQGPFGAGGFGQSAREYAWATGPLAPGVWSFGVVPYDAAGAAGDPVEFTAAVAGAPQAPPTDPDTGRRLAGSYDAATRTLTLAWLPSQP